MATGILFLCGLIVYIGILGIIGYATSKKHLDGSEFLSGGKSVGVLLLLGTLTATIVGTNSSIGATSNGYLFGWAGSTLLIGLMLGSIIMQIFVPTRKYGFLTMAEELQFYYGGERRIRQVVGVATFIIDLIWVATNINGGAKYLCYLTNISAVYAKMIVLIGFWILTFFGGFLSVIITDTIQMCIIFSGFIIVTISAYLKTGGYEMISLAYSAAGNTGALDFLGIGSYGIMPTLTLLCSSIYSVIAVADNHTRMFAARSNKVARKAIGLNTMVLLLFSPLPALIGMCAFTITQQQGIVLENADYAFVFVSLQVLPFVFGLIFLIAGLSATISSGDSCLITSVTIALEDIYPSFMGKHISEDSYKKASRVCIVIASLLSFVLSLYANDILSFVVNVVGSFLPCVGICALLGKLWKRCTWQGGLTNLICGILFAVGYLTITPMRDWIVSVFSGPAIPATVLALFINVIVSLCTKVNTKDEQECMHLVHKISKRHN